jgi:hypothetical protein
MTTISKSMYEMLPQNQCMTTISKSMYEMLPQNQCMTTTSKSMYGSISYIDFEIVVIH